MAPPTWEPVELTLEECLAHLGERGVGRLAVDDGEGPVILPVNYLFHGGVIHIRTGDGTKLDAADRRAPAAFEVDRLDPAAGGWSVLVRGRLRRLMAPEGPGDPGEPDPVAAGDRHQLVGLVPVGISGIRVGSGGWGAEPVPHHEHNVWHGQDGTDLLG